MSEPFIGQMLAVGFNFAPRGWMFAQGQIIGIAQNTAMFSLLGVTFGGNGQTTFGLPDTRGRTLVGQGSGPGLPTIVMGEMAGTPTTTLNITQMPAHNHSAIFTPSGGGGAATGTLQAMTGVAGTQTATPGTNAMLGVADDPSGGGTPTFYVPAGTSGGTPVNLGGLTITGGGSSGGTVTVGITGNNSPVPIMQPFLGINYIIATEGIFPSRN